MHTYTHYSLGHMHDSNTPRFCGEGYELKSFVKTALLQAGESVIIPFKFEDRDWSVWDSFVSDFVVKGGEWKVGVGGGSRDIRLVSSVEL